MDLSCKAFAAVRLQTSLESLLPRCIIATLRIEKHLGDLATLKQDQTSDRVGQHHDVIGEVVGTIIAFTIPVCLCMCNHSDGAFDPRRQ